MSGTREDRNLVQVVIGLGVLALGVLFTLDNLGTIDAGDYIRYWPLALIGIGLAQIAQCRTWSSYTGAVLWMLAGLWFLGRNIGLIRVGVGDLWPLIVAGAGALLVFRGWRGYDARNSGPAAPAETPGSYEAADDGWFTPKAPPAAPVPSPGPPPLPPTAASPEDDARRFEPAGQPDRDDAGAGTPRRSGENVVNAFVIMGGITRRLSTLDFKGGTVVAIMGGAKIDLRAASITQGEAAIDVLAFWGGIEIRVPDDWIIVPQVFPFMGGFDDKTGPRPAGARKRLVVRGLAFMGGVEVKK